MNPTYPSLTVPTLIGGYPVMPSPGSYDPRPPLSDAEVRRIAEAVCDEQERRAAHPLYVSAEDRRRWMP